MAIPTLSTVAPSTVWTGGQMVTLTGTNFRPGFVETAPSSAKYPAPKPTVKVTAGGVDAKNVRVLSATSLTCIVAAHDPGAVSVTVQNLDNDGVAIPGETVTLASAFTYARPDLQAKGDYDRLNHAVIQMLKRQIIANVSQAVNADYGETPFESAYLAALPALALSGGNIDWSSAVYQTNAPTLVGEYPATTFETRRRPIKVDIDYELAIFTRFQAHMTTLKPLVLQFFDRNQKIVLARDPDDDALGTNEYDMFIPFGARLQDTTVPNGNNIHSAIVPFRIRGFGIESIAGFPNETMRETGGIVSTVTLNPPVKLG